MPAQSRAARSGPLGREAREAGASGDPAPHPVIQTRAVRKKRKIAILEQDLAARAERQDGRLFPRKLKRPQGGVSSTVGKIRTKLNPSVQKTQPPTRRGRKRCFQLDKKQPAKRPEAGVEGAAGPRAGPAPVPRRALGRGAPHIFPRGHAAPLVAPVASAFAARQAGGLRWSANSRP